MSYIRLWRAGLSRFAALNESYKMVENLLKSCAMEKLDEYIGAVLKCILLKGNNDELLEMLYA